MHNINKPFLMQFLDAFIFG